MRKLTIKQVRSRAQERGFTFISPEYKGGRIKHEFQCPKGHQYFTMPESFFIGNGCPCCYGNKKLTIKDAKNAAEKKGGTCLAKQYPNNRTPILFKCAAGHTFYSRLDDVQQGKWCPSCQVNNSELITRFIFEEIFQKPFLKVKFKDMINLRGNSMELDGYCQDLKLAFEYQGIQHYEENEKFHGGRNGDLVERKNNDKIKKEYCKKNKIHLICIPYKVPLEELKEYIIEQVKLIGQNNKIMKESLDLKKLKKYYNEKLQRAESIIKNKGGDLLDYKYEISKLILTIRCHNNHVWTTNYRSVNSNRWCRECYYDRKRVK